MNRTNHVQDFLYHMSFFRKDEMDTFFSLHQEKFVSNKLAEFNSAKAIKLFTVTSVFMTVAITTLIFTSNNLDTIAKLIYSVMFSSFSYILNIFFIAYQNNKRFKLMQNELFEQLNILKNKFFYNFASRQAIFQHIPNSFAFYGEDRFNKIMKDCEIGAMTTQDLYFILNCIDNEKNFGLFLTFKNNLIKMKNFTLNSFTLFKPVK